MSYTKLFNSIITSTIWTEDDKTRILWITMLALADKNGEVQASIPGLARVAGITVADCEAAIRKFLDPDPYSRTPDDEGRRIEAIPGGWALLNHGKYREMASRDELKEAEAERKRRYRERQRRNGFDDENDEFPENVPQMSQNVPDMSRNVPKTLHIAEADTDTEADVGSSYTPTPSALEEIMPTGAAKDMLALQAKIQGIKPSWKTMLTRIEQQHLMDNAGFIADLADHDWQLLKDYMSAKVPQEKAFWQPYNRSKFIETIGDVYDSATRWRQKHQDRRQAPPAPRQIPANANQPKLSPEETAELLKIKP
jgi:hypothetical protein